MHFSLHLQDVYSDMKPIVIGVQVTYEKKPKEPVHCLVEHITEGFQLSYSRNIDSNGYVEFFVPFLVISPGAYKLTLACEKAFYCGGFTVEAEEELNRE